jgi:putative pyruvate formate lyase activating enzyme
VDRRKGCDGFCRTGRFARVASFFPHRGEEACFSGWRGSGTIFFSGCNLGCVFCQNWDISHDHGGRDVAAAELASMMLELQEQGCHNINWVTPSHVVPQALEALELAAAKGLELPIVYNTGGYDSIETLHLLDGVVDIYMPDFKFWDPATAERLVRARDYPEVARAAIREMHRQVGDLVLDGQGIARRGLLVRHLVMPNGLTGTGSIAEWLTREISRDTWINVMAQYHPEGLVTSSADAYRDIASALSREEFLAAVSAVRAAGLYRLDRV